MLSAQRVVVIVVLSVTGAGSGCSENPVPPRTSEQSSGTSSKVIAGGLPQSGENSETISATELVEQNAADSEIDQRHGKFPSDIPRPAAEAVLDAILADVLNNSHLKSTRDFYGTTGDGKIALVHNPHYGVIWPEWYRPSIPGFAVTRISELNRQGTDALKLVGVRIDKFKLDSTISNGSRPVLGIDDVPISVTILNAGGTKNGHVIGGCSVFYKPIRSGEKWTVKFCGLSD